MPASHAGRIKTDAGEQADAERQAKKRLGVESAEHRTPNTKRKTINSINKPKQT